MEKPEALLEAASSIRSRVMTDGSFAMTSRSDSRVDATAWAAIALSALGGEDKLLLQARANLASCQSGEGGVPISKDAPESVWPTPLAIMAWKNDPAFAENARGAADFLLRTSGNHFPSQADSPVSHDTDLIGWPWSVGAHSWVEPTSMALLALKLQGFEEHHRSTQGRRLLLDRQLPSGGWNYGNVRVYGKELPPNPECTGMALTALYGHVHEEAVAKSLALLERQVGVSRTPMALFWAIIGLCLWGRRPAGALNSISLCLEHQQQVGPFETWNLGLGLVAGLAALGSLPFKG